MEALGKAEDATETTRGDTALKTARRVLFTLQLAMVAEIEPPEIS